MQNHQPDPRSHRDQYRDPGQVGVTPGADNFSDRAAGGMAGIAFSIADQNARQSGLNAMTPADPNYPQHDAGPVPFKQPQPPRHATPQQYERGYDQRQQQQQQYDQGYDHQPYDQGYPQQQQHHQQQQHQQQYDNRNYDDRQYGGAATPGGGYGPYPDQEPTLPNIPLAPSQAQYRDQPSPYSAHSDSNPYDDCRNYGQPPYHNTADRDSNNSMAPFGAAGMTPGHSTPQPGNGFGSNGFGGNGGGPGGPPGSRGTLPYGGFNPHDHYADDPYNRYSTGAHLGQRDLGRFDPATIADDGDDGLVYERARHQGRASLLSLGRGSNHSHQNIPGAAAGAMAGAGVMGAGAAAGKAMSNRLSGLYNGVANQSSRSVGQGSNHSRGNTAAAAAIGVGAAGVGAAAASGPGSISGGSHGGGSTIAGPAYGGNGATGPQGGGSGMDFNDMATRAAATQEKGNSEWLTQQNKGNKKWKWCIWIAVILVVGAGVACGVVFGVVLKDKKGNGSSSGSSSGGSSGAGGGGGGLTAGEDTDKNGDLDINSKEIQELLNNPNLHKVFPGIDYTPINSQFPDCLSNPPSQNNITRDLAVLSQLTNTVRLYGTDCNQTEMLLHARERLQLTDTVKIWLGVWQDGNTTTNERQLAQMWSILDTYGHEPFKGVIVANEILFREQMTATQLGSLLQTVRQNVSTMNFPDDFVVATSDLGDKWDSTLASISDAIMGNIHPFFAGVTAEDATSWTMTFWENKISSFKKSDPKLNIISETGWPTAGGKIKGSVASIDELNTFMDGFVCEALTNGTEYFWFEAFDEPWKIAFNEPGKEWEDKWGLLTVDRVLKDGVKIPDCGGKTVD